ncbi:MAG: hypothetical protein C4336_02620 [Armatimonadota bacterium]
MIKYWLWGGIAVLGFISPAWSIGTEGRSPHERPDWWKQYENVPPVQVAPEVVAPQGSVPNVIEESATRTTGASVPDQLVIQPEGASGSYGIPKSIDGVQVVRTATRDLERSTAPFWRSLALFGGFFLLGGGAVFGLIRWLSAQVPEPPRPTRRRRY